MEDILEWLQYWYKEHYSPEWERSFGISITTLDNPGWHLRINLKGTKFQGLSFQTLRNLSDQRNWHYCSLIDESFDAACGPKNLIEVIRIFQEWIKRNDTESD
jgi:hypothetical protein